MPSQLPDLLFLYPCVFLGSDSKAQSSDTEEAMKNGISLLLCSNTERHTHRTVCAGLGAIPGKGSTSGLGANPQQIKGMSIHNLFTLRNSGFLVISNIFVTRVSIMTVIIKCRRLNEK